jgi:transcriptional regulator of arginine metabolism
MPATDSKSRLLALRRILDDGKLSTQEELAEELNRQNFVVTQSTISRDLRRIGAVKVAGPSGTTTYKLGNRPITVNVPDTSIKNLIVNIKHNESLIVIHTTIGSASMVANYLDHVKFSEVLGTIAGDDTIFVAPSASAKIPSLIKKIQEL